MADPTTTDPDKYRVVFENDRVRVVFVELKEPALAGVESHLGPVEA